MNPTIVARSLVSLMITALLLLSGCEELLPTAGNPPAVVPNLQPGAPIPGGLRIAYAHATPLLPGIWKKGTVNVHFNGAATTQGTVKVEALRPGWTIYTHAGEASFVPGQTDVQVPISVLVDTPVQIPLEVSIRGSSAVFQTMTHYSGDR
jgi:hypothetical protein